MENKKLEYNINEVKSKINILILRYDQFKTLNNSFNKITNSIKVIDYPKLAISFTKIQDKISELYSSSDEFIDFMLRRGKDIIMISDQANHYLCNSNDAMDRIVSTYLWLPSKSFEELIAKIDQTIQEFDNIIKNILRYKNLLENNQEVDYLDLVNLSEDIKKLLDDLPINMTNIISYLENTINISNQALDITTLFSKTLDVITSVSVNLTLSQRMLDTLTCMNLNVNSPIKEKIEPRIEKIKYSKFRIKDERYNVLSKYINYLMLNDKYVLNDKYIKLVREKQDVILDINYPTRLLDSKYIKYIIPLSEIYDLLKVGTTLQTLDLQIQTLSDYYGTLKYPVFTLEEFLNEMINVRNEKARLEGLGIIYDYLDNKLKEKKDKTFNLLFPEYVLQEELFTTEKYFKFDDYELLGDTDLHYSVQHYIQQHFQNEYRISNELQLKSKINELYNELQLERKEVKESGVCSIVLYNQDGSTDKIIDRFAYNIEYVTFNGFYRYLAAEINNKHTFLIDQDKLHLYYNGTLPHEDNLNTIIEQSYDTKLIYNYLPYCGTTTGNNTFEIDSLEDITYYKSKDVLSGNEEDFTIKSNLEYIDNELYVKQVTIGYETKLEINVENEVERTVSYVTNNYREEAFADKITLEEARNRSILVSLEHLKYKDKLDNFIDNTWKLNIPNSCERE